MTVDRYQLLYDDINACVDGRQQKMNILGSFDADFGKLRASRWQRIRQVYKNTLASLQSDFRVEAKDLETVARLCQTHGLLDGQKAGEKYSSLQVNV
jgi:hypothetical protein